MIETNDLIIDKAKFSDWEEMYREVWSQPECARYMMWNLTQSEEDAKARIQRTLDFQKTHDTYFVYEKAGGKAMGFAGVERLAPFVYAETGICLGVDYMRRGYGKQIVQALMDYVKREFGARAFVYSARAENTASNKLAAAFGFTLIAAEDKIDDRDGHGYRMLRYVKALSDTEEEAGDFSINEMRAMQRNLQLRYRGKWESIEPETGKNKLLWMIGEVGEVIDIVKKNGGTKACEDTELRKELAEELADVLMYFNDVLLCYGITAEELKKSYTEKYKRNLDRW